MTSPDDDESIMLVSGGAGPSPADGEERRRRQWCLGCGTAIVACIALVALLWHRWGTLAKAGVAGRLRAIRDAGDPVTLGDLAKTYAPVPEGENGAPLLQRAFALMDEIGAEEGTRAILTDELPNLLDQPTGVPPETLKSIRSRLAEHDEVFPLMEEALRRKVIRFELDLTEIPLYVFDHHPWIRKASHLYALRVVDGVEAGDPSGATDALCGMFRLGSALDDEPFLISVLISVMLDHTAIEFVKPWLHKLCPSSDEIHQVQVALRQRVRVDALAKAIVGGRCLGLDAVQRYQIHGERPSIPPYLWSPSRVSRAGRYLTPSALITMHLCDYIDDMGEDIQILRLPYPQSLLIAAELGSSVQGQPPRHHELLREAFPFLTRKRQQRHLLGELVSRFQTHLARLETARLALAIARYRLVNDRLPDTPDATVPAFIDAVPVDPFDGNPLRYKGTKDGFIVYSTVRSGDTDRGNAAPERMGVSFRVGRPATDKAGAAR